MPQKPRLGRRATTNAYQIVKYVWDNLGRLAERLAKKISSNILNGSRCETSLTGLPLQIWGGGG